MMLFLVFAVTGQLVGATISYLSGDAMIDITQPGPDGEPYPSYQIEDLYRKGIIGPVGSRHGRTLHHTMDPLDTRETLLKQYKAVNQGDHKMIKTGRSMTGGDSMTENLVKAGAAVKSASSSSRVSTSSSFSTSTGSADACPPGPPARLCKTRYNTTAPMYGVSLTSGQPVTIVQKFPDLLQQVIFEVCETDTCDVVQGSCVQTYVPYLFLVIPLGPVTLTGQDYVLVESGCVCQPKYAAPSSAPSPIDALQG
ncbi:unnamed protein product [Meganyctiphanes norvegica]|uniref:Uncharacterized protein n=1 Tax=Meganyctiphanes norvegica TaxID=48144 RepID=A0AAV2Q9H5_MEGNR